MSFPIHQIRFARPTDRLQEVVRFYEQGLLFPIIGSFQDHAGYDGVMLGMPDGSVHLEFTQHVNGSACPAPAADNLLVLYFSDAGVRDAYADRLAAMGYAAVPPENPYWTGKGITIPDPDGWRVVLFHEPA
jgi:catechol 2,3-dioxygenase-like lactoylglutathione lyase family enzyme